MFQLIRYTLDKFYKAIAHVAENIKQKHKEKEKASFKDFVSNLIFCTGSSTAKLIGIFSNYISGCENKRNVQKHLVVKKASRSVFY